MSITRHNYEEFFILYLDNELSREDRGRVELFVQQHPDLGEELEMLQQTKLVPDTEVVFRGKHSLIRSAAATELSLDNYQEWLLLYVDDELTTEQEVAVENFAVANPVVKTELDILQRTKLQPEENIVFFNKDVLYRREEKTRRIVAVRWRRIAAAAALLFAVSVTSLYVFTRKPGVDQPGLANANDPKQTITKKEAVAPSVNTLPTQEATPKENTSTALTKENNEQPVIDHTVKNNIGIKRSSVIKEPEAVNEALVSAAGNKNLNDLPLPVQNRNMTESFVTNSPKLTDHSENNLSALVTNADHPALEFAKNSLQPDTDATEDTGEPSAKKSRFRGLLRKITRTIEKTTNIKATDDEDRLLVGNLAIRL